MFLFLQKLKHKWLNINSISTLLSTAPGLHLSGQIMHIGKSIALPYLTLTHFISSHLTLVMEWGLDIFGIIFFFLFSFLECASICAINSSCLALHFNKVDKTCKLRNTTTDFKIQTNQTLWSADLMVHVKDGVNLITNGNSNSNFNNVGRRRLQDLSYYFKLIKISGT